MLDRSLREGGPHDIRYTGPHQFSMEITLPTDEKGMTARQCTDSSCSPGEFKVKGETDVADGQKKLYCPYCRTAADPNDFATPEQLRYGEDIVTNEVTAGTERMLSKALKLGPNGKRTLDGGLLSIEMSLKPTLPRTVQRPREEQFRRDVACPHCSLEHAVYGLAVWCPDCGEDIFITHVESETQVLRIMLADVDRRKRELGPRVAARDIENVLEDVVSIAEASFKALTCRRLLEEGKSNQEVEAFLMKKIRNRFQSYDGAVEILRERFGFDLTAALDSTAINRFRRTLEKRHPIAHNLGIVDRKYLGKVQSSESEGQDVRLSVEEVTDALEVALVLIRHAHEELFPDAAT